MTFGGELTALGTFLFFLRPDDVVWDIGGSVGLFTVHAAGLGAHVVAVEPDAPTSRRLQENVILNGLGSRVTVLQVALSDKPGTMELYSDGLVGNAPSLRNLNRHRNVVSVTVDTVDRLVAGGARRPTVLKIDVEGAEGNVLAGASQTLRSPDAPRLLFVEVHPDFLAAFGWSVARLESELRTSGYLTIAAQKRDRQSHVVAVRGSRVS